MNAKNFYFLTLLTLLSLFFVACGDENKISENDETTMQDTTAVTTAPPAEIKLAPFPASSDFSNASLNFTYDNGKFQYNVQNYELKKQTPDANQKMCANSNDGQHIHLIIDNEPYEAVYETTFEKAVPDGEHYVLSFLSRSYHESIKSKGASMAVKADFSGGKMSNNVLIKEPMLFYSRPKGKYVGKTETDKVLLDYYLLNTELSASGNKVKVLVNGDKEFILEKWEPVYLEGLPMGDNKIQLTLIDKDGNPVNAPLNPVERVFTLIEDPAPTN